MDKTFFRGGLAFCIAALIGVSGAQSQPVFDPMRPAVNPLAPMSSMSDSTAPDVPPNPEFGNLPDAEGVEDTYYQCVACHSTAIIRQQHLTDARWDYLWTWMVETQGMYEPDEETRDTILAYLKTHFSSER